MPFLQNDTYCSGGSVQLGSFWQPTVFKFDTSSFYNWEQDNEPIYDLEDRTGYLWEKAGFPASSLENTGVTLVVSGTASGAPAAVPTHGNIYTSVSAAIEALPDVLRFPTKIEVAIYSSDVSSATNPRGTLGNLNLQNIKFANNGCLEIVNRVFARPLSQSIGIDNTLIKAISTKNITQVSSLDTSNTLADASAVSVYRSIYDMAKWNTMNRVFLQKPEFNGTTAQTNILSVGVDHTALISSAENTFNITPYGSVNDGTVGAYDVSVTHTVSALEISRDNPVVDQHAIGLMYGNFLDKIKVENCNGPIYIRNFCVDGGDDNGAASAIHTKEIGIEINNSNVVLENCAAMRCNKAGIELNNSKVILNRGVVAYRNYEFSGASTSARNINNDTPGLRANNSYVIVSSTDEKNTVQGRDTILSFSQNAIGIELNNSVLTGGLNRGVDSSGGLPVFSVNSTNSNNKMLYLQAFNNTKAGIVANNSLIDVKARLSIFQNLEGCILINSCAKLREAKIEINQNIGLSLHNSKVRYNSDLWPASGTNSALGTQLYFNLNGQHLSCENSEFLPTLAASANHHGSLDTSTLFGMPNLYGLLQFTKSHGGAKNGAGSKISLPSISLKNNSKADFVHCRIDTETGGGFSIPTGEAVFGAGISVDNGSSAKFNGSKTGTTILLGPAGAKRNLAGMYVNNNSNISFAGPTILGQCGVNVLADNNSKVLFSPHTNLLGNYDPSSWQLSDTGNHTSVELHSTRSCLVADHGSKIAMEDLGDYHEHWSDDILHTLVSGAAGAELGDYNAKNPTGLSSITTSGYVQFYPNPQQQNSNFDDAVDGNSTHTLGTVANTATYLVNPETGTTANHSTYSLGGTCVRALRGSEVKVKNVHFPAGWLNPSGIVYDVSDLCSRLYIWNIADDSELNASYCSVSASWPASAVYHGPSSVYSSGTYLIASGAPSSTPDTSSLSILDSFGNGTSGLGNNTYGKSTFDNRGPFRLYFSPMGPAKWLGYASGTASVNVIHGAPYQVLAQGYNPSGDCSSTVSGVDWSGTGEIYQELFPGLKAGGGVVLNIANYLSDNAASSFFYGSEMTDKSTRNRVRLDDSAMNVWANAKNATLGTSGRNKLVTYYRALIAPQGEGFDADQIGHGLGFLSANEFDLNRKN